MHTWEIKSISYCCDIWYFRADGFIASVKQRLRVFSEVHRGKGDLESAESNYWD